MEDVEYRIGKLSVATGDVLVVKVDTNLTQDMAERIKAHVGANLPAGVKVMAVGRDIDLSVLSAAAPSEA